MSSKPFKITPPQTDKQADTPLAHQSLPEPDDRYPGSFFRVPGVPVPGKTAWSIVK
jgi:hypothetical protein